MLTQKQKDEIYDDVAARQRVLERLQKDVETIRNKEKQGHISGLDADIAQHELEQEFDLSDEHEIVREHSKRSKTDQEVGKVLQDARLSRGVKPNSNQNPKE